MSLLTNSSIALFPDGGKAGKLYSLIPSSGDGDFTVARAGDTATRVNEQGLIEVVPANVPRIDFTEGTGCGSLLIEPQRTNVDANSNTFLGTGASVTTGQESPTISGNEGVLLEGDGTSIQPRNARNTTFLSAGKAVISVRAKAGTNDFIALGFQSFTAGSGTDFSYFDLANGTTPTSGARIESLGNGWYQCFSAPYTIDAGDLAGLCSVFVAPSTSDLNFASTAAANGQNVLLYGFQVETGAYGTSYIPTSGSTATRNADVISLTSVPELLGDSEGTIFIEASWINPDEFGHIALSDGTTSNRIYIWPSTGGTRNARLSTAISVGDTGTVSSSSYIISSNTFVKLLGKYATNNLQLYYDGNLVGTDTSVTTYGDATLTNINFADPSSFPFYGRIKALLIYQAALDADTSEVLSSYSTFAEIANNKNYTVL